jgi:uncharacterized protein YegP (UPF0339 family)
MSTEEGIEFETYTDNAGEFRWRAKARNGSIMADSGESYTRYEDAERAKIRFVELIIETFGTPPR